MLDDAALLLSASVESLELRLKKSKPDKISKPSLGDGIFGDVGLRSFKSQHIFLLKTL